MVFLKNGEMTAEISETGAELKSLKKDGFEYIWCGDPSVWQGTAPVLFPTLCSLKDNKYILNGTTYEMPKHGFVKNEKFILQYASDTSATFLYTHNDKTLAMYPFKFEFRVIFTLNSNSLSVEFRVNNLSDCEMYFSVGAHEAYATPEGVEEYDIIFSENENLDTVLLTDGGLLRKDTLSLYRDTSVLPIREEYFALDTLIFKNLKSKSLLLKNRKNERAVRVDFPDCNYLGIWHKPNSRFLCVEPWAGLPDNDGTDYNIKTKEGIITLAPRGEYKNIHKITL